ncbi:MAG TPA: hypothetical protein VKS60_08855 [Stellaceae bacterium]|nr:hypothetical protein [Stellaceae bacterium]
MLDFGRILDAPRTIFSLDNEAAYGFHPAEVEEVQLAWIRRHFAEMRPRVQVVDRLARDIGVTRIDALQDITSLCLPHTMYKSYASAYVEQGRFDRMTKWLGSLTAIDLSQTDTASCDSLDTWLDRIEAETPLRPLCSSGTSGKVSFFPRCTLAQQYFIRNYVLFNAGFRDEPDSGLGEVEYFTPWPVSTGRHNQPRLFSLLREVIYEGRPDHVHTLGRGHQSVEMLWLAGQLKAAERKGDLAALKLSPAMERVRAQIAQAQADTTANLDSFIDELAEGQRGRRIFMFALADHLIPLAQACKERGRRIELAPDSYFLVPGKPGMKGMAFPDGWLELCKEVFPHPYQGIYGMTEATGHGRLCPAGHYHMPPWIVLFLLDPDTSVPRERQGVQTGRLTVFDLTAETYWGGAISGDRATIDWRGFCSCGRRGPFVHDDITRYGNLRDDDKITCSRSSDAYEQAARFVLGSMPE